MRQAWIIGASFALAALALAIVMAYSMFSKPPAQAGPYGGNDVKESRQAGIDWDYWRSVNPDVVGWIRVEGTQIDYPIVQASPDDPDHYLNYDVYNLSEPMGLPLCRCGLCRRPRLRKRRHFGPPYGRWLDVFRLRELP